MHMFENKTIIKKQKDYNTLPLLVDLLFSTNIVPDLAIALGIEGFPQSILGGLLSPKQS